MKDISSLSSQGDAMACADAFSELGPSTSRPVSDADADIKPSFSKPFVDPISSLDARQSADTKPPMSSQPTFNSQPMFNIQPTPNSCCMFGSQPPMGEMKSGVASYPHPQPPYCRPNPPMGGTDRWPAWGEGKPLLDQPLLPLGSIKSEPHSCDSPPPTAPGTRLPESGPPSCGSSSSCSCPYQPSPSTPSTPHAFATPMSPMAGPGGYPNPYSSAVDISSPSSSSSSSSVPSPYSSMDLSLTPTFGNVPLPPSPQGSGGQDAGGKKAKAAEKKGGQASSASVVLPPCRICLDRASGFHYGLNTCEACKGFFRRSLKRGVSYKCLQDEKCNVTGERRNVCAFCRYQKCLTLGMSKKAIKTGRYTHAKRTQDTLEVKKLKLQRDNPLRAGLQDLDTVIAKVLKAHDDYIISSTFFAEETIAQKQQAKVIEKKMNDDLYGVRGVSQEQDQDFKAQTGMDLDNRRELMEFHIRNSERWIRGYISFAKNVPGFRDLPIVDQANLVKFARIEFWFLGSYRGYNSELGVAVMPNGRCFTREEMYTVWKHLYIDVAFDLAAKLRKLNVTPQEMILIKAICLTAGDRCKFEEPKKVEQVQLHMIRCLEHLLHRSHPSYSDRVTTFCNIFVRLADLRDLNEAEYNTIQHTQLYEKFMENPLMVEVLPY